MNLDIQRPKSRQPLPENATKVFTGVFFDVYQWEQTLYDGTKATFEKIKRPDTVVVFPILDDGKIVLTEQTQPGKEPFTGTAGGTVNPGESVLDAAKRELLEETGLEASELILWDAQQPASKIEWAVYIFIAKGLTKRAETNLDAGEKINLKFVDFEEFLQIAISERFAEKEITTKVYQALLDPQKKEELRTLLKSK